MTLRIAATFRMSPAEVEALSPGEWAHLAAYVRIELEHA